MSNPADAALAQPSQQQKFMRYRSVRKTVLNDQKQQSEPVVPLLPQSVPATQTSIARLPSRYHRKPKSTASAPPLPENQTITSQNYATVNELPAQPVAKPVEIRNNNSERPRDHNQRSERPSTRETRSRDSERNPSSSEEHPTPERLRRSYEAAREEARLILEGEVDRLKMLREQEAKRRLLGRAQREKQKQQELLHWNTQNNTDAAKWEERKLAGPSLSSDSTKLTSETVAETRATTKQISAEAYQDSKPSKSRRLIIGGPPVPQSIKKHRRISSALEPRQNPRQTTRQILDQHVGNNKTDERRNSAPTNNVPNYDAPVSAVNSGERRVSVKCKNSSITLPITPSTTSKDILNSASLVMSESIDARTAVLIECFAQLGLERPLRRYERIRDVMNSWSNDTQNHLLVMDARECAARGLNLEEAPSRQPLGIEVQIYYSQKPGKWDKRWLKLWDNGQVSVAKNEGGIDCTNICHLSDFDLYTPTARQIKKVKPPKKLCFALKSQQKASMFLNGANFAHFFCTKEKEIADQWYQSVHSWRSWYLVNMLGEGQHKEGDATDGTRPSTGHSKESVPYVLGSFKPLLDFERPRPSVEDVRHADADILKRPSQDGMHRPLIDQVPSKPSLDIQRGASVRMTKSHGRPPTAYTRRFAHDSGQSNESGETEESPFTGTGLLARSATKRSQGGYRSGRGASGAEGKPLVDLQPTSEFTDGSLLRKIEAMAVQEGALAPKIDRQKRQEVNAPVGEGY